MARPYQIRSRYGQNEPTGGERISGALTSGLDAIASESAARRDEENDIRARGGVQVGAAPSVRDRINGVRQRVGRVFGRGGPPAIAIDETMPDLRVTPSARPQAQVTFGNTSMQLPTQVQRPKPSPIANALGQELGDTSYEMKSRSGARYRIDPMRGAKAEAQMRAQQAEREHGYRAAEDAANNASRERVAGIGANQRIQTAQTTYAERRIIAERANAARIRAAEIAASGRANTAEGRAEMQEAVIALREAGIAMQAAGIEASGYENQARAIEAKIPTGTNLIVEQSTPEGRTRIDSSRTAAAAARDSAQAARTRGAQAARSVIGQGTKTPTASQLARAKTDPQYRQFLIEKGYKVP